MATIKQAQQPPANMKDLVPVYAAAPVSGPPVDNEFTGLSQTSIGPVPGVLTTTYDSVRQWTRPGTAQFRTFPLPPRANPQINSIVNSAIANIPAASVTTSSGMIFKGVWNNSTNYSVNDVVIFNKSAYIALQASSNVQPDGDDDPPQWQLLGENFVFNASISMVGYWGEFDKEASNSGTGATASVGPITPSTAGEIALSIGYKSTGGANPPSGGWSILDTSSAGGATMSAYVQIQPTTAPLTTNIPLGSSLDWDSIVALFASSQTSFTASITKVAVSASNIVTVTCNNTFIVGTQAICSGLTNITALNGVVLTILTASSSQFTATFTHAPYGPTSDSGTATDVGIVQNTGSTPGNVGISSLTFTNPVTPGNTVVVLTTGINSGGFPTGYGNITSVNGINPATWTVINSQSGTGGPHCNIAFVQNAISGQTVTITVQNSLIGARFVILELAATHATQYLPYDVLEFNGNNYVCLEKTASTPSVAPSSWGLLGIVTLPDSGVTPGSYTLSDITVNAQGIITAASSGSGGSQFVAAGTVNLSTNSIISGAAAPLISVAAPGVLATDTVMTDFSVDPTGTTGYKASTNGTLTILKFCTSGFVNFYVINDTQNTITPGAVTLNWKVIRQVAAAGTATLGTSAISSGTAATIVTVPALGVLATDNVMADFNADPTGTTGYAPSSSGGLIILKFCTAGNVNFYVINNTANSITPGAAITLNWRVTRQVIASGTVALGTSSIASGAAATLITVPAIGVLATDNLLTDFNADPTSTTGYIPTVNGMLSIVKFCTAGNVNFYVLNNTAAPITPGAVTLNWRVIR